MEEEELELEELDGQIDEEEDTQKDKYLTFQLAGEEYGIHISHVIEIIGIQKITEVPDLPPFVRGVINLRGNVIPVIDVRLRFAMQERPYDARTCIVVVNLHDTSVGLVVDEVREVADIPEDRIEPAPRDSRDDGRSYIGGLGKKKDSVVILLDVDRVLYEEEVLALAGEKETALP